ncbi:MAG: acylphosphatase [Anaerolineae bacterium]|nr:acylphosphatase [Thermoflexales bacterium]MDW8408757.1 acylphosphatase [Anaerolineae bacterium]
MSTPASHDFLRLHAIVEGIVQGVNFRQSAAHQARALGLTGWIMNRIDGSVETIAEGPRNALEAYLDWLRRGPPAAVVRGVNARWETATGEFDRFRIEY